MEATPTPLGHADGREITRYRLVARGLSADVMNYGATLMALRIPDRAGRVENVVLGFDALEPYIAARAYFGAIVGRYANRIGGARFLLDGVEHALSANEGRNHLHGGEHGFDKAAWSAGPVRNGVEFSYRSADGEEGYPGELSASVVYQLTDNRLVIDYRAATTKPTHVNPTHHSYFHLGGDFGRSVEAHRLLIAADRFTPVDAALIPTGELALVSRTPFDFRTPTPIGARIDAGDEQLRHGGGYDHNYVLNKDQGALARAAVLHDPRSGRVMEVWTTEPGLQFYSGNQLNGSPFPRRAGLCLEPQHFPDSPNRPEFPSTVLRPGETYRSRTEFRFGVKE